MMNTLRYNMKTLFLTKLILIFISFISFISVFLVQNIFRSWKSVIARSAPDPVKQQMNHATRDEETLGCAMFVD